jgi:hypothetical protein
MSVLITDNGDHARMTLYAGPVSHKFEVWPDKEEALVEYQESLVSRGQIRVTEPSEQTYRELMRSSVMTEYLESHNLDRVRKADARLKYSR